MPTLSPRRRSQCLVSILAVVLAACGQGAITPTPAVSTPAASPSPATPDQTVGPVAIADGTYVTKALLVADIRAAIAADDKLTEDERKTIIESMFELDGHDTMVVSLTLDDGQWTQSGAFDGGALRVGSRATYAFADETTVVISEQCCGLTTFTVTPDGAGFTLDRVSGTQNTELDIITGAVLFESAPFLPAK